MHLPAAQARKSPAGTHQRPSFRQAAALTLRPLRMGQGQAAARTAVDPEALRVAADLAEADTTTRSRPSTHLD